MIRIYADFQKSDRLGDDTFLILTTRGTMQDLAKQGLEFCEGLQVMLYADDLDKNGVYDELEADAEIRWSEDHKCWIGVIDTTKIRHTSDRLKAGQESTGK